MFSNHRTDHVVLAMAPGQNRTLLLALLESFPDYEVSVTAAGRELPDTYDICLLDVASFRVFRAELEAQVAASDPVYLPHVLLVSSTETTEYPRDRLPGAGSIGDSVVNEAITLPVQKAVLHRRIENLLTTRRTAVRLAEREEQYQRLVELTPEGIVLVAGDEVVYANSAARALFGGEPTVDLVGESVKSFVPPESATAFDQLLEDVSEANDGQSTAFRKLELQRSDGGPVDASVAGVPVMFEGERVVQLLFRDLTDENRRKEQLQLFGQAVESVAVGVTIADARQEDQPIVYANEGFQRLTGYPLVEVLGRNCRFLQGPKTNSATRDEIRHGIQTGGSVSVDILNYRKDGTTFWNRLDINPVHNEDGELTHFLGFQQDMTERIRRKQRLAVLNRILRHNVRNKTNVISGYAESIRGETGDPEAAASRIIDAADDLLTISEQIREFDTVIEEGVADTERIDLSQLVEEATGMVHGASATGAVDIQTSVEGETAISAHHTLRAALNNLFALLAEPPAPDYLVRLDRDGDILQLAVVDRSGVLTAAELALVETGTESSLEHLQRLELWLLRWAVDQSNGVFVAETLGEHPGIRLRFEAVD